MNSLISYVCIAQFVFRKNIVLKAGIFQLFDFVMSDCVLFSPS